MEQMEPISETEITHDFFPFFKVLKDGSVQRYLPVEKVPPSNDPSIGFRSKDEIISSDPQVSARIFLPFQLKDPDEKLSLLLYIHGGAFCIESAFSQVYHHCVGSLAAQARVLAVSVEYRLAPENPLPACYEDTWAALQWVASHANGDGPEPWLNTHADFQRVILAGDSAGANLCHNLLSRIRSNPLPEIKIEGAMFIHPYFGGSDPNKIKLWLYLCPDSPGLHDPRLNPSDEDLRRLGCERAVVFVAEKDFLKEMGMAYYENLRKSGWHGKVELIVHQNEGHVFHLTDPKSDNAANLMEKMVAFLKK